MVKRLFTVCLILAITVIAACGDKGNTEAAVGDKTGENVTKDDKVYTVRFGHVSGLTSHYHKGAEKWKELLEKNSNGRLKVEIFGNSQLGGEKELVEGMRANTIQAAVIGATLPIIEPKFFILDMPYLFEDYNDAHEQLLGELGTKLFDSLPAHGLKGGAWTENGFRAITNSKKPINTPEDLKGLKIRTPENKAYVSTFKLLGANPTPLPFPELFNALEQGVVDGQENPLPQIHANKFHEVQDHITLSHHLYGPAPIIVSLKFYDSLPDDLKKIIDDAAVDTAKYQWDVVQQQEEEILKELKASGMQVVENVDKQKFRQLTPGAYDEFESVVGKDIMDLVRK